MAYSFDEPTAPERHETQYFEMFVNRGIYHQGWTAVTRHSTPWLMAPPPPIEDDVWELYGPDDWTQSRDLAAENPDKLHELQRLFLIEAVKYDVLPLDDAGSSGSTLTLPAVPSSSWATRQLLFEGMGRLTENSVVNIKNRSPRGHRPDHGPGGPDPTGVLIAQGGAFGGWIVYLQDGLPVYCYNLFGLRRFKV